MRRPTVYVVEHPERTDERGARVPARDLSDASRFGRIVYLLSPSEKVYPSTTVPKLRASLAKFGEDDFLVAGIGHPLAVAWAAAIASERVGGRLRLLYWQRNNRRYIPVSAALYTKEKVDV